MEENKHTEENNLNINMETDSNINTVINTEGQQAKKTRGRPKITEQAPQNNNNLDNVNNKDLLNLQDKLTKLKKAEAEYNNALSKLRK